MRRCILILCMVSAFVVCLPDAAAGETASGNIIAGTPGNDDLRGTPGNDTIYGLAGDDKLYGQDGNDALVGGPGDDYLEGGPGNDAYVFGIGDGHDTISERDGRKEKYNAIRLLEGVTPDSVSLGVRAGGRSSGLCLVVQLASGETITVDGGLTHNQLNLENPNSIQAIIFADDTTWQWQDIIRKPMTLMKLPNGNNPIIYTVKEGMHIVGTDDRDDIRSSGGGDVIHGMGGDDSLYGNIGNDILWGGAGDDYLEGNQGDDVYLFGPGDGHDIISERDSRKEKRNIIGLREGVTPESVRLRVKAGGRASGLCLVVELATGDTISVDGGFTHNQLNLDNANSIQAIEFADGTTWEWEDILQMPAIVMDPPEGSTNPILYTVKEGMYIAGSASRDDIRSSGGGDIIYGMGGNDSLYGNVGDDIIWGGPGDDYLEGNQGDDLYLFGLGDGHDTISERDSRKEKRNIIRLLEGIAPESIRLRVKAGGRSSGLCLVVELESGETIAVDGGLTHNQLNLENANSIQAIEFEDGPTWEWEDILDLPFFVMPLPDGGNPILYTVKEGMYIVGTDGPDDIRSSGQGDVIFGGAGDDKLYGNVGNDVLWGGPDDDKLEGGQGDDVYIFAPGDGDDIVVDHGGADVVLFRGGLTPADVFFTRSGNDLVVTLPATDDTLTVRNQFNNNVNNHIEKFRFEAGGIELRDVNLFMAQSSTLGPPAGPDGIWSAPQREKLRQMAESLWHEQPWDIPPGLLRVYRSEGGAP